MLDSAEAYGLTFQFPAGDTVVGETLRTFGEFSRVEVDVLLKLATEPSGVFLDVGANIGSIALPFAKQRPAWRGFAIEAQRGICNILASNIIANRLFNVEAIHAAAGPEEKIVEFPTFSLSAVGNFGEIGFAFEGAPTEQVRMLRLDAVAPRANVVKMDIQGFEPEALKGAQGLLRNTKPAWIVEADRLGEPIARETIKVFFEAGYDLYWLFVPFATPSAVRGAKRATATGDFNIIALAPGTPSPGAFPRILDPSSPFPGSVNDLPYLRAYGFT
jgi:FkbM family methyltransferase